MNLVRLTDKALREYEQAREMLLAFTRDQNRISNYFRAIDHLENCVSATHRASLQAEVVRPRLGRSLALTGHQKDRLVEIRDVIEHMDDRLTGKLPAWKKNALVIGPGEPTMLMPLDRRVQIGSYKLTYRDLASCISKLYRLVMEIREVPISRPG